jgi:hypothetical protein
MYEETRRGGGEIGEKGFGSGKRKMFLIYLFFVKKKL